jgi:3-oxoacyl-[acyl-carrier-protein] synthase II
MPATGEVNSPFTSLRGTHVSGGACVWIVGDVEWCDERGLRPIGGYVESVALSSDAEHIITPSKTGPRRAIERAYHEAQISAQDVALIDLHATGTPGDLNELALIDDYITERTQITARKGQLGHGMANSGGWELTALAMGLARRAALPTGIRADEIHPRVRRFDRIVTHEAALAHTAGAGGLVGVKLMLGIGGITACVVLRGA